jgi:transcriptional regulator with XRE-family HTH domain
MADSGFSLNPLNSNAQPIAEVRAAANEPTESQGSGTSEQRRRELADFLRTRREKLKPEQVGIAQGSRRRTPGLRREEVAELAGVGTTWYTWLEQARDIQPSTEVLRRLGNALQLNPAELRHMFALAGKAAPQDFEAATEVVSPEMLRFMEDALKVPAILVGSRWDILSINTLGHETFAHLDDLPADRRNWLYYVFVRRATRERVQGWETHARRVLAEFRASLSESLDNPWVLEIVDMLKAESPEFAKWWREHDVRDNSTAIVEVQDKNKGLMSYERAVLRPWDNMRYKILVFTPVKK